MFIRDIALKALRKAGLAHGENVPADRFGMAVETVADALRFYSDCDTITCFSEHRRVNLGNETTIGNPVMRRGVRMHKIAAEDMLPDLSSYTPADGSYVIGRDFWHCDDTDLFYTIRNDGEGYSFDTCEQPEFATTTVDIYLKDISKIIAVYRGCDALHGVSLSKFFGLGGSVYVANVDGLGRLKVMVHEPGEYEIVYTRALVFNEHTQIDLPASQEELIVNHTAYKLARSSEKKAALKMELDEALEIAQGSSLDTTIPTRSEW